MRLAKLHKVDPAAMWATLTAEQRADIGAAVIAQELARLVAGDDGAGATRDDRQEAERMADEAGAYLAAAVEAAFPAIAWWAA